MPYLMFQNEGELDVKGLMLMGASSKRGDASKIGEYGTGWKYAIACLLRNNVSFEIYAGTEYIRIETKPTPMSGHVFQEVIIDNKEAHFTIDMGKDWELWMAIREIYCNSLDEPGSHIAEITDEMAREFDVYRIPDRTIVLIQIDDAVRSIIDDWDSYFAFNRNRIIVEVPGKLKVYEKLHASKSYIYRKGIRVAIIERPGCFDYDFEHISINEIREADYVDVLSSLKTAMTSTFNAEVLQRIMKNKDCWEQKITFYGYESISNKQSWESAINHRIVSITEYHSQPGNEIKKIVGEEDDESYIQVPFQLAKLMSDNLPDVAVLGMNKGTDAVLLPREISDYENEIIAVALDELEGYDIMDKGEFVVSVCKFENSALNSTIQDNTIILNAEMFEKSNKSRVAYNVIIEIFKQITCKKHNLKLLTDKLEQYLFESLFDTFI